MPTYCTSAKLTDNLPSNLPDDIDATYLAAQISDASAECDELVGSHFSRVYESNTQKFPDITSTPETPKTIEQCALWLALSRCYEKLDVENYGAEDEAIPRSIYFRNKAEAKLAQVRDGVIELNVNSVSSGIETAHRYLDSDIENDKDWQNKLSEMDVLLP